MHKCRLEQLAWLRRFLPFRPGITPAQMLWRVLRALDPKKLERALSSWLASLHAKVSGVVAINGESLRGSKQDKRGAGVLRLGLCVRGRARAGGPRGWIRWPS
jgi:hypothetical protein